ncbi:hypothetical protein R1sor_025559 [Riccia sorocarpa]|uniref:Homeobox domain-containing protein n=1 Tax=Riccia sorocarpa TaxID=122646 RepID=A0ABD3GCM3_9MARC
MELLGSVEDFSSHSSHISMSFDMLHRVEYCLSSGRIKDWINEEREASIAAVEAARQNEAQGAPPGPRPLPVDTGNHLSVVNGKARLILKHWVEQHHEYPFTIKKERKELAELTGLDKKIVKRFINVYRKYNKHRLNMERDLHRHNEMNLTGHGRDFGPRYRLVGATIEVPESEFVGQWQPEPPPPTIAPTIAPSSVEDDLSDTESGDEEGVDEELDKDVDKEVAKVLGRRAVDSDSEGSGEDGDEVENYEKMIESQLDILRQYVQEGKMTLEEAQAVAGEGEGGMNEDRELENVVLDELAVAFLPQLTDPDIKQRWRRVFMVGGSQYISKRWIPSPSVDEDPFDLVARAKEQVTANVGPKVAKVAWNRMKEDFKCLIAAHQASTCL